MALSDLGQFAGHTSAVFAVACSKDGRLVASGAEDGDIRIWAWDKASATAAEVAEHAGRVLPPGGSIFAAGYDSDSAALLVASESGAGVARLAVPSLQGWNPGGGVVGVATETGTSRIAFAVDQKVTVRDLDNQKSATSLDAGSAIRFIAWCDKSIATAQDHSLALWDPAGIDGAKPLGIAQTLSQTVGVASAGKQLVTIDDAATPVIRIWGEAFDATAKLAEADQSINASAASANGNHLAVAWVAAQKVTIAMWSVDGAVEKSAVFASSGKNAVTGLALSDDGGTFAWTSEAGKKFGVATTADMKGIWEKTATNPVTALALTSDGASSAFGDTKGTVVAVTTDGPGTVLATVKHTGRINSLAFKPTDSNFLYSASEDLSSKVWKLSDGTVSKIAGPAASPIRVLAVTPTDQLAAGAADGTLFVWAEGVDKPSIALKGTTEITAIGLSGNAPHIATAGTDNLILLWDIRFRQALQVFSAHTEPPRTMVLRSKGGWPARIVSIGFGADKRMLASEVGVRAAFDIGRKAVATAFAATDDRILVGLDKRALAFTLQGTMKAESAPAHPGAVSQIAVGAGSTRIAFTASSDAAIRSWDVETGAVAEAISKLPIAPNVLAADSTGQFLAVGSDAGDARFYAVDGKNNLTLRDSGPLSSLVFLPKHRLVSAAIGAANMKYWDGLGPREEFATALAGVAASSTASWLTRTSLAGFAFGGKDKAAHFIDYATLVDSTKAQAEEVRAVAVSPDQKFVVTGGLDKKIVLWNASTLVTVASVDAGAGVSALGVHKDNVLVASGTAEGTVALWKITAAPALEKIADAKGHTSVVTGVVFSPNGTNLASLGNDGVVVLWDAATLAKKDSFALNGADGLLSFSIAWLNDATLIVGSADRKAHVIGL